MRKVCIGFYLIWIFAIGFVNVSFAQDELSVNDAPVADNGNYGGMSEREIETFYRDSCDKEYTANCYQLSLIYKNEDKSKLAMAALKKGCAIDKVKTEKAALAKESKDTKNKNENDTDEEKLVNPDKCNLYKEIVKLNGGSITNYYLKKACPNPKSNIGVKAACDELNDKADFEGSLLIYYTSLFLVGLAVFLIAITIFQDQDQHQATENLEDASKQEDLGKHGFIVKFSRPFFRRYFVPIVSGMKNRKSFKEKYRRPLAAAGLTGVLTPEDFFAFKLFLILGFPVAFVVIRAFLGAEWPFTLVPVSGIVGFYYPDLWISGKISQRQKEIIMNMPFGVDMLALSVEAGLDFIAAMSKVIEKSKKNALSEEFEITIKEIKIGASRAEALRNFAWRADLIQISSFCATLIAADSVGASIGPILKSLAAEIRQKKSSEVEKAGATAATKILFPMMFLIVPSVLLIVFSPIIVEAVYGPK